MQDHPLKKDATTARASVQPSPWMHSRDLFGNADQVVLIHEGQYYRLRRTRNGKLILNK